MPHVFALSPVRRGSKTRRAEEQANANRERATGRPEWLRSLLRPFDRIRGRRGSYTLPSLYPRDTVLSDNRRFKALGLHVREAEAFQTLADQYRYHIFVRTGHASRVTNVGQPGRRPKPAGVYQKTNKQPDAAGLVIYRANEAVRAEKDLDKIKNPDPADPLLAMHVLAKEGLHLRALSPGVSVLRDRGGNFFYGDIDIHGVYRRVESGPAETVAAETFVPLFNAELTATGLHRDDLLVYGTDMQSKDFGVWPHSPIQHGAHDEWKKRNDASYAGGVNMGPLPGVIYFAPSVKPRHVSTVSHYRDILASFGRDRAYTGEAWSNGRNRLSTVRYAQRRTPRTSDEFT